MEAPFGSESLDSISMVLTLMGSFVCPSDQHERLKTFIPIYPNALPNVPKPPEASRTAPLVFINLPASQTQSLVLLNRCTR